MALAESEVNQVNLPVFGSTMFAGLGRILVVILVLGSLTFHESISSFRSNASPVRNRYVLLSVTYRKKIQEKIEAPFVVASALPTSLFAREAGRLAPAKNGMSGWLIPYGDPVFGSISLQL
jgi:hypothetical protein